jgi:acetyltransferase-like isoleucine patch superfamily enzyme
MAGPVADAKHETMIIPAPADPHRYDFLPWLFAAEADAEERRRQSQWQQTLLGRGVRHIGEGTYLSPLAAIHDTGLSIGRDSYVAAHVYLTGDVEVGDNSSVNPYAVVRGRVRIGTGVRIGAHASLVGFNHTMAPDEPVFRQPLTSKGIAVGDDVWIGSNVIIVDGVTVGAHSVLGAGAVVTKDVPPWSVMAGNPARRIRDRRDRPGDPAGPGDVTARLTGFGELARATAATLLDRYWRPDRAVFVNQPDAAPTLRATADAVEIADLLLRAAPPQLPAADLIERLAGRQDPATGLIADDDEPAPAGLDAGSAYHILSAGYALDLLGARLRHPVHVVRDLDAAQLLSRLDSLPWTTAAWTAGAWIDGYATALHWNRRLFGLPTEVEALFGWLLTRQDRWTGLWGSATSGERLRQPVNGYYRLTRGTFAQFGLPVPRPEQTIDSVLAHSRDPGCFGDGRGTACDELDVVHPLWLCGQQTRHRRDEVHRWARQRLDGALSRWQAGAGFAFSPTPLPGTLEHRPSLMGTEMWLAIIWLLADVLGESGALGYRPRGVHRPDAAA